MRLGPLAKYERARMLRLGVLKQAGLRYRAVKGKVHRKGEEAAVSSEIPDPKSLDAEALAFINTLPVLERKVFQMCYGLQSQKQRQPDQVATLLLLEEKQVQQMVAGVWSKLEGRKTTEVPASNSATPAPEHQERQLTSKEDNWKSVF